MELLLDSNLLENFLNLRPKVFLDSAEWTETTGSEPLFDLWLFEATADFRSGFLRPADGSVAESGKRIPVKQPPAGICLLLAGSEQSAVHLEMLKQWWDANGHGTSPSVDRFSQKGTEIQAEILRCVLRAVLTELDESVRGFADSAGMVYDLRQETEQAQIAMQAMQQELQRVRHYPTLLFAHMPPGFGEFIPEHRIGRISQALPASAKGLAGFDLHFGPQSNHAKAQLLVRLHAHDIGADLGQWFFESTEIRAGWVRCWLPEVCARTSHALEIQIEWTSESGSIAFSLSDSGDWDELRARNEDGTTLAGCLALMIWTGGTPGARLRKDPQNWCPPQPDGSFEYRLAIEETKRMLVRVPPQFPTPIGWNPLTPASDGSFQLHPAGPWATTSLLPDGCAAGLERITATIRINHPLASAHVQFAIMIVTEESAAQWADEPNPLECPGVSAFSGWHAMPPDEQPHVFELSLDSPLNHPAHLVLATRIGADETINYAWADWVEIRFRVRGMLAPLRQPASSTKRLVA